MGRTQGQRQNPEHNRHHSRNVGHESTQAIPSIAQGVAPLIETLEGVIRPPIMAGGDRYRAHFSIDEDGTYVIRPGVLWGSDYNPLWHDRDATYLCAVRMSGYCSQEECDEDNRASWSLDMLDTLSFCGAGTKTAFFTCDYRTHCGIAHPNKNGWWPKKPLHCGEKRHARFRASSDFCDPSDFRFFPDEIDWQGDTDIGQLIGPAPVRFITHERLHDLLVYWARVAECETSHCAMSDCCEEPAEKHLALNGWIK